MALFDKMKESASQVAQKAQEAGKAGQAKLDQAQAKRKADGLLRELGSAVYAARNAGTEASAEIERLVGELKSHEAEHGTVGAPDTDD
jgi:hypothetical protein